MAQPVAAVAHDESELRRAILFCSAGGFLDGYDLLIMGAALLQLVPQFHLGRTEVGWLTSLPFLTMAVGALVAGRVCDAVGRRTVYLVDVLLFLAFSLLQAAVSEFWRLVTMRMLVGFAIGMDMPTGSSMLAEYAPPERRGGLVAMINTAWLCGGCAAALVGFVLFEAIGPGAWRWMFGLGALPALLIAIGRHNLPETPYWQAEIRAREQAPARLGFGAVLFSRYRRPVLFFTLYMVVQAMAGGPPFIYTALIFRQVIAFTVTQALLLNAALLLAYSLLSIALQFTALERWGRKPFAIAATALAACGALATAWLQHGGPALVAGFFVFAVGVQMSTIPFWPWSVEQLPTRLRATGQSLGSAGAKLGQFVGVRLFTPDALSAIGWTPYFLGVAGAFALLVLATALFGPETRRVPLET